MARKSAFLLAAVAVLTALIAGPATALSDASASGAPGTRRVSATVEHAFGSGDWASVGVLQGKVVLGDAATSASTMQLVRNNWSDSDSSALAQLAVGQGLYKMRVTDPSTGRTATTSINASCLAGSKGREKISVNLDHKGHFVTIEISTPASSCASGPERLAAAANPVVVLAETADVVVKVPRAAPTLDFDMPGTADASSPDLSAPSSGASESMVEGQQGGTFEGDEKKKKEEPKSWIQRNWMLVLAGGVMLLNVLGNAAGEPQGAAGASGAAPSGRRPAGARR